MKDFRFLQVLALVGAAACSRERLEPAGMPAAEMAAVSPTVSMQRVSLVPRTLYLYIGQTGKLTPVFFPSNATDKRVRWSASIGGGAWVDQNGVVTAIGRGWTNVTVHTVDGDYQSTSRVYSTCNDVAGVEFGHSGDIVLTRGERFDLMARSVGEDPSAPPSYPGLIWSSSNPETVSVDSGTGRVTARATGRAAITATSSSDTSKYASCGIVVLNAGPAAEGGVGFVRLDE